MPCPRLLVVAGPNGSGKSSITCSSGITKNYGENIINPDNYARGLSDIEDRKEKYIFAMKQCELLRNNLLDSGSSFGFETVASTQEKIDFIQRAAEQGYKIDILFVSLESAELCYQRVQERVKRGGHDVERSKVFARYERTMRYLKEYIRIADTMLAYDNSGRSPVLVFSKEGNKMKIMKEPARISWVDRYVYAYYKDAEKIL